MTKEQLEDKRARYARRGPEYLAGQCDARSEIALMLDEQRQVLESMPRIDKASRAVHEYIAVLANELSTDSLALRQ